MITFGITGNIAVGKSNITGIFRQYDIPIVDADVVARQVVAPGTGALNNIIFTFGKDYLNNNGELDRIALGELVFNNNEAMVKLKTIMSPLIQKEVKKQIENFHLTHDIVGYDGAMIIESGNDKKYHPLIVVYCSLENQIKRLIKRNNLTQDQALARINSQLPMEVKIKYADYLINTDGSLEETAVQTFSIIQKLKNI